MTDILSHAPADSELGCTAADWLFTGAGNDMACTMHKHGAADATAGLTINLRQSKDCDMISGKQDVDPLHPPLDVYVCTVHVICAWRHPGGVVRTSVAGL